MFNVNDIGEGKEKVADISVIDVRKAMMTHQRLQCELHCGRNE